MSESGAQPKTAERMFERVLVANRGEIAVRIISACQTMGIRAIAVYSEADRDALHVRCADEAYCIGPAPAVESYLNIGKIVQTAREHRAQAIHPGYGFLSENADFAEACAAAGIVFVGPTPAAMRLMGSKIAAKEAVEAVGVPTVPGYSGGARDLRTLRREAARVGYPLMLKAAAGGGGKGMRVVRTADELPDAIEAARREALAAFGDDAIFFERLVERPRHIEFQILADRYGHTIHLGERDCSVQRRHQKVIEESPSPALTDTLRRDIGEAAVRAAQAAGYVNAGTCEFLLAEDGAFYFLEMNTRLQVEHPVTELVTGVDMVRLQLEIAAGVPLRLRQEQIVPRGHAIEARIYAEDPTNDYLPSTGRLALFDVPRGPGIRLDAGVDTGDEVTVHYDPMLAKLIAYGEDRAAALERLAWALEHSAVLGVTGNLALLRGIVRDPDFRAHGATTAFLSTHTLPGVATRPAPPARVLAAAALYETLRAPMTQRAGPYNPWTGGSGRAAGAGAGSARILRYLSAGTARHTVTLQSAEPSGAYHVQVEDEPFPGAGEVLKASLHAGHTLTIDQAGELYHFAVATSERGAILVSDQGTSYTLTHPAPLDVDHAAQALSGGADVQQLVAPMSGTVIRINVREGDQIAARQPLVILGAMKMEHAINAPFAGRVRRVHHVAGDVVPGGAVLIEVEAGQDDTEAAAVSDDATD